MAVRGKGGARPRTLSPRLRRASRCFSPARTPKRWMSVPPSHLRFHEPPKDEQVFRVGLQGGHLGSRPFAQGPSHEKPMFAPRSRISGCGGPGGGHRGSRGKRGGVGQAPVWARFSVCRRSEKASGSSRRGLRQAAPAPRESETTAARDDQVVLAHSFPADDRRRIRSTNPLERISREIGWRTDVVGILPNDRAPPASPPAS